MSCQLQLMAFIRLDSVFTTWSKSNLLFDFHVSRYVVFNHLSKNVDEDPSMGQKALEIFQEMNPTAIFFIRLYFGGGMTHFHQSPETNLTSKQSCKSPIVPTWQSSTSLRAPFTKAESSYKQKSDKHFNNTINCWKKQVFLKRRGESAKSILFLAELWGRQTPPNVSSVSPAAPESLW